MLRVRSISDEDPAELAETVFDLAIFSSGYESRARYIPSLISPLSIEQVIILGFREHSNASSRLANDRFFKRRFGLSPYPTNGEDDAYLFALIEDAFSKKDKSVRILVDYTSMSRTWYATVLNWLRYRFRGQRAEIFFTYATGRYPKQYPSRVIKAITPIAGCEGYSDPTNSSVAVFGLGFESFASLTALDYLEPDRTFGIIAAPDVNGRSGDKAEQANIDFLKQTNARVIRLPLMSVRATYAGLVELVAPYLDKSNVSFVSLGPKPHVLATILVSMRFPNVTCLHVQGSAKERTDVKARGAICVTRVGLAT